MPRTGIAIRMARTSETTRRLVDAGGLPLEIADSGGRWWCATIRQPTRCDHASDAGTDHQNGQRQPDHGDASAG